MKLHAIIDVKTRIILAYFITNSHVADISALYTLLGMISRHAGSNTPDFCLDAAYLSRDMCDMLSKLGFAPCIKPKKYSTQCQRKSALAQDGGHAQGESRPVQLELSPAQYRRIRIWRTQDNVWQLCKMQKTGQQTARDCNARNLLQHRPGLTITSRGWQAHTPVARDAVRLNVMC